MDVGYKGCASVFPKRYRGGSRTFPILFDTIFGLHRPDGFDGREGKFVGFFGVRVVKVRCKPRVGSLDNGWICVVGASGESLPELLRDEWHERMDQQQRALKACIQGILSGSFLGLAALQDEGL